MSVIAIIQARMTSSRLPGKVMMDLGGKPLLQFMLGRVQKSKLIDKIIVAVPDESASDPMIEMCRAIGVETAQGDELDVLSRFVKAAKEHEAETIVRLCSDCPLIDPVLIDKTIQYYLDGDFDYVNNVQERSYPDGLDCEIFKAEALYQADMHATHPKHREHVTTYIDGRIKDIEEKGDFKCGGVNFSDGNYGHLMWSVNEQAHLDHIRALYDGLKDKNNFNWLDVLAVEEELNDKRKAI